MYKYNYNMKFMMCMCVRLVVQMHVCNEDHTCTVLICANLQKIPNKIIIMQMHLLD